jgi:hypothetical protein
MVNKVGVFSLNAIVEKRGAWSYPGHESGGANADPFPLSPVRQNMHTISGLAFGNPSMVLVVSHFPLNIHASRETLPETLRGVCKSSIHIAAECKICVEQVDISWGDEEWIGEVDVCC